MTFTPSRIFLPLAGGTLALCLGTAIGTGSFAVPVLMAVFCLATTAYPIFARGARIEATILGFLLAGYIVGNRGFAELSIVKPVYLGEAGMASILMLFAFRIAFTKEKFLPKIPLAYAILALFVIGTIHLYSDVRTYGMLALRDFATVYYSIFFFIAYRIGEHEPSRQFLHRLLVASFLLLIPIFVVFAFFPVAFEYTSFRGFPVIYHKGDLLGTFLGAGSFYLYLSRPKRGLGTTFVSFALLCSMLFLMSRASFFGFALGATLLVVARQSGLLFRQGVLLAAVLFVTLSIEAGAPRSESRVHLLYEKFRSMTDISGSRSYEASAAASSAQNNRFRTFWWRSVYHETMGNAPFTGLGFGYDLAARFLREYEGFLEDFTARSPHSIIMTFFGRLGIIGLASWLLVVFVVLREALRCARAVRRCTVPVSHLAPWCAALPILGSGCFGVVLEGPMGGILFWTLVGLAASQRRPEMRNLPEEILCPHLMFKEPGNQIPVPAFRRA